MHEILSGFPILPYMEITTTSPAQHPSSIRWVWPTKPRPARDPSRPSDGTTRRPGRTPHPRCA
ncbi:MAG TPA: hypothetical protein GXZ45_00220 [Propionibacterium sp.]|nr:hypothetical protein [Propionibacterium sp.]